jgi:DeoR family fructose operon transcriptional repressor
MLGEERREYILNIVNRTGSIKAFDIARTLDVSEITIRRDLQRLAKKGLVRRTHGGAMNILSVGHEMKFDVQKDRFTAEKKRIALEAASMIEDGDVILIEAGTTGYQIVQNTANKSKLTVITNSCDIASLLANTNPNYKIIISGGILNTETHSLVGPIADWAFENVFVDKAFVGISGIDIEKGITAADQIEARTKKNIINCAKTVIALADHSKIGHVSMNFVAPVDAIDVFITDGESHNNFLETLKSMDIEVIIK